MQSIEKLPKLCGIDKLNHGYFEGQLLMYTSRNHFIIKVIQLEIHPVVLIGRKTIILVSQES
jgi:hypothetical protein